MDDRLSIISYTLAAMAGVCFVSGLAILQGGRVKLHGKVRNYHIHVR